jgi:single-strand DNA-binding protein
MVNKVVRIGNLGRDPELFHTQSGQPVVRLSVATNEVWTKNGERQRRTEWHRGVVWGPRAEWITAQLRKETSVYVEGRLRTRTFTNADNVQQMRTEIYSQRLMSLGSRTQREAAYAAAETDGFRNGDEVPF